MGSFQNVMFSFIQGQWEALRGLLMRGLQGLLQTNGQNKTFQLLYFHWDQIGNEWLSLDESILTCIILAQIFTQPNWTQPLLRSLTQISHEDSFYIRLWKITLCVSGAKGVNLRLSWGQNVPDRQETEEQVKPSLRIPRHHPHSQSFKKWDIFCHKKLAPKNGSKMT